MKLTPEILRPINTLTRASPKPGFLDYNTYLKLLVRDGHIQNSHPVFSPRAPIDPTNSSLQAVRSENRNDNKTDFRADQALWSLNDLPHILYLLQPPSNWVHQNDLKEPPLKKHKINGKFLRDIPILPDHISSNLEGWRLQAWYCFDPRIKLNDIMARIKPETGSSTLQMRSLRFRTDFPALGWANKGRKFESDKAKIAERLRKAGIDPAGGTTRGLAWGLVDADDPDSKLVLVPSTKGWESSVETVMDIHLEVIPSPFLRVSSDLTVTGSITSPSCREFHASMRKRRLQARQTNTIDDDEVFNDQDSDMTLIESRSQCADVAVEGDSTENELDAMYVDESDEWTPTRPGPKRKHVSPDKPASKRRRMATSNTGDTRHFESGTQPNYAQWQQSESRHLHIQVSTGETRTFLYPPPDEVPRPPRITHPLEYQKWDSTQLPQLAQSNNIHINGGIEYAQEPCGLIRLLILHQGVMLRLKTLHERQHLSPAEEQLLNSFYPVGTNGRFQQLEYLLDPVQAQFGFEDRNGQWGATNWDVNMSSNIVYAVDHLEASARLAARMRGLEVRQMPATEDTRLRFHPCF